MNKSDLTVTELLLKERERLKTRIIEIERVLNDAGVDFKLQITQVSYWYLCILNFLKLKSRKRDEIEQTHDVKDKIALYTPNLKFLSDIRYN